MALAEALKSNTTLEELESAALPSRPPVYTFKPRQHARALHLPLPSLTPSMTPFTQPWPQRARPRGWHGARRGPQEQHSPQKALVCCPAIEPTRPITFSPHHMHPHCTRSFSPFLCRVSAGSATTSSAPRAAWRSPRPSRATRPSSGSSLLPRHRIHPPILLAPTACTLAALAPAHPSVCRVRSLGWNQLGPEGGMALAEALKSNTTLKGLRSVALPSNLLAHAQLHPLPRSLAASQEHPAPARTWTATSHSLRVPQIRAPG